MGKTILQKPIRLLFVSTSVGPLGSGEGGGVELTLLNTARLMVDRGHSLEIVAPRGSELAGFRLTEIDGALQVPAQTLSRDLPIAMPKNSVLENMWAYVRQVQGQFDLIVNFAYDWLPFYLTPFLTTPVAHLASMGSLTDAMDAAIERVAARYPHAVGVYTRTQAETFVFADRCTMLGSGLDLSLYDYCEVPDNALCWLGRISPEKGLEDAVAAVQTTGIPLKVMGRVQDRGYFDRIYRDFPHAPFEYLGFFDTAGMQQIVRQCRGLLVTSRWVEAFGNVLIEALACGVPVIAYRRGGPTEIVKDGKTGWLVEPDSVGGLIAAIAALDRIDRKACRLQAEREFSLGALGDRTEAWFDAVLKSWPRGDE
ncbi:glycosyltransferase family 4 protein [Altericista sp. CCNU0014]|uniref:glycosyltransferase family 4 protein n=1 Tax=Altericista sp. CCNU0014 TaxID=3082949 RepID=UPI003850A558